MEKEDFEFKPLTDGLGFYSRAERLKQEARQRDTRPGALPASPLFDDEPTSGLGPAEASLKELMSKLPPSLDFEDSPLSSPKQEPPKIYQALPREKSLREPAPRREMKRSSQFEMPASKAPVHRKEMEESLRKAFPQAENLVAKAPQLSVDTPAETTWVPAPTAILAAGIDFLTVIVLGFFCVLSLMAFAKIDLVHLIQDPRTSLLASLQLGILIVGISFIYQLATRSLLGNTLGDWAMDVRLGTPAQQSSWYYPVGVLWRHLVFWLTGVVVIPLLSLIFRRDLAKYLTGLTLHKRKYS